MGITYKKDYMEITEGGKTKTMGAFDVTDATPDELKALLMGYEERSNEAAGVDATCPDCGSEATEHNGYFGDDLEWRCIDCEYRWTPIWTS